jgi:hypothetical protein
LAVAFENLIVGSDVTGLGFGCHICERFYKRRPDASLGMHCKALRLSRGRRGVDEELLRASAAVADLGKRKKVRFDIKRDLNPVFQSKLRHLVADA